MLWAMMFTVGGSAAAACLSLSLLVCARMSAASLAARSSMEPVGGTEVVMTEQLFCVRACLMPCQYSMGGRRAETLSSEKPRRPWARTMGYFGVAVDFISFFYYFLF